MKIYAVITTISIFLCICAVFLTKYFKKASATCDFIKWVDFKVSHQAIKRAYLADKSSKGEDIHLDFVDILALCAIKCGGDFNKFDLKDMDGVINDIKCEKADYKNKYYPYYKEVYSAVLDGFVGAYFEQENGVFKEYYGIKAFCPIAKGFHFSHYRDFGSSRSYGFKRKHLGNDLLGSVGTPVIAVESGYVEALGWNRYGGWRIGIRSFDSKRYYYYAHLRKDFPYHTSIKEGMSVKAGDVIGYLGMTGYSEKENVNNINIPHLHFGMEIIFDESQKDSDNEIWIDVYDIVEFLKNNKSEVEKNESDKNYYRTKDFYEISLTENGE